MEWSSRLKQARNISKLTQEELAIRIGVSRSTIANYEMGRRKPSINELKRIAVILHIDINYLLEHETNKTNDLLVNATNVFNDLLIADKDKDELFQSIVEIYFKRKSEIK